jgi:glycosyltransferase involved in cell wall biosynthesis
MQQLRDRMGLSETDVIFEGERSDLEEIYGNSDLLVLTSEYEGTPNVVLEAMAHGIPVLATGVGGVPELLSNNNGALVDASDFEALVQETEKLIMDPERRRNYILNGRSYIRENHSFNCLRKQLTEIYRRQLGRFESE